VEEKMVEAHRFQAVVTRLYGARVHSPGPLASREYETLVEAVMDLAKLCSEQAVTIEDLREKVEKSRRAAWA
jgi:hypothetical protein